MLKVILLPVLTSALVFFGIPMLNEYATDPCGAYDKLATRTGAPAIAMPAAPVDPFGGKGVQGMLQDAARGQQTRIKPPAPGGPPDPMIGLTCTTRYWQAMTGIGKTS
jgi:hypothetical protein